VSEYDFEPVRGLPGDLPTGEHVVWQGAPDWRSLAAKVFHVPLVGLYFLGLMSWRIINAMAAGDSLASALVMALWVTPLAVLAIVLLSGLAWLNSRTTVYTITNKRVVMRFGAALTKAINIPFSIIESASLQAHTNGRGDIALKLVPPNKVAYLQLWPHARPGRLEAPQPTFRAIVEADHVAALLAEAVRSATPDTETVHASTMSNDAPSRASVSLSQPALA
jgi:Bacterial PH domain